MKNMNMKLRLQNKATVTALAGCTISFIYSAMSILEISPTFPQDTTTQFVTMLVGLGFAIFGAYIDPTTPGVKDSERAMAYKEPGVLDD